MGRPRKIRPEETTAAETQAPVIPPANIVKTDRLIVVDAAIGENALWLLLETVKDGWQVAVFGDAPDLPDHDFARLPGDWFTAVSQAAQQVGADGTLWVIREPGILYINDPRSGAVPGVLYCGDYYRPLADAHLQALGASSPSAENLRQTHGAALCLSPGLFGGPARMVAELVDAVRDNRQGLPDGAAEYVRFNAEARAMFSAAEIETGRRVSTVYGYGQCPDGSSAWWRYN